MAPFTMAARKLPEASAQDFGITVHERAPAVMFPALGAYVGPDIVAGILATGLTLDRRIRLFIDVGTNSEMVLGSSARALATAAPAGPAFEAAQIRCGMRASDGAIEGVKVRDGEIELTVIGDVAPVGLCGSGLVDAVAELVGAGIIDKSGRYVLGSSRAAGEDRRGERLLPQRRRLSLAARRARAAVREGVDRDGLGAALPRPRRRAGGDLAGAARRLVRLVPLRRERRQDRARAEAAAAAHRLGRERRRRGREDRRALGHRACRGDRDTRRGRVRRALRPRRLQRPVHRPARFPV